jgi:hypothetical protein
MLRLKKEFAGAILPVKGTAGSAGLDLFWWVMSFM